MSCQNTGDLSSVPPLHNYRYNLLHVLLIQKKTLLLHSSLECFWQRETPKPQNDPFIINGYASFEERWVFLPCLRYLDPTLKHITLCTHHLILLLLIGQTEELYLQCQLRVLIYYYSRPNPVHDQLPSVSPFNPLRCFQKKGIHSSTGSNTFYFHLPYSQCSIILRLFQKLCCKAFSTLI